jgi:hydroxymethylbilane synthase
MTRQTSLRLGTRSSALARWQADWVAARLIERGHAVEQVLVTTSGDVTTGPLDQIGGRGLFTSEIQRALLDQRIDLAVHSLKDLPTESVEGLSLGAVPPRAREGDVLVTRQAYQLGDLPQKSVVGTGSNRRRAHLLHARPDLEIKDIRGNVETRLKKLDEGRYDAIILAEAGLARLELTDRISYVLPKTVILPAVGQGALGLEIRSGDNETQAAIEPLNDPAANAAVTAERTMLAELRAGCLAPVGAWAYVEKEKLVLQATVLSVDGKRRVAASASGEPAEAAEVGRQAAALLIERGAAELLETARN